MAQFGYQYPVEHVEQVEQTPTQLHTGTQVQVCSEHPEYGLQEHMLVAHTESHVHTMLQLQLDTGTQVQTELQEHVPLPVGAFSSGCIRCTSLSGIFRSTEFKIFGFSFPADPLCSLSFGLFFMDPSTNE